MRNQRPLNKQVFASPEQVEESLETTGLGAWGGPKLAGDMLIRPKIVVPHLQATNQVLTEALPNFIHFPFPWFAWLVLLAK